MEPLDTSPAVNMESSPRVLIWEKCLDKAIKREELDAMGMMGDD